MAIGTIDVVLFREGEQWLAVATNKMAFTQGRSMEEARARFAQTLSDHVFACEQLGARVGDDASVDAELGRLFAGGREVGERVVEQFTLRERVVA